MIRPSDMLYSWVVALWCLGRWTLVEGFSPVENCQQAGFLPGLLFRARNRTMIRKTSGHRLSRGCWRGI